MNTLAEIATNHDSVQEQGSDGAVVELPSRWIAAALSGHERSPLEDSSIAGGADASLRKEKWAGMRLVDTVALDDSGEVEYWLFTAKTGHITSKKRARDRVKIAERFERFALANPRNTERYVALASNGRGRGPRERVVLDKTALLEAMAGPQVPEELLGATLQCYLRPQNGSNSCLRGCYRGHNKPCAVLRVTPLYQLPTSAMLVESDASPSESPIPDDFPQVAKVRSEVERVLVSLVAFLGPRLLESKKHQTIRDCDADFIVDDNGELWMTSLPRVTVTTATERASNTIPPISSAEASSSPSVDSNPSGERGEHDDDGGVVATAPESAHIMPPLGAPSTQEVAPLDGGGSPPGSARRLKPSDVPRSELPTTVNFSGRLDQEKPLSGRALPAISTMLGARSDQGDHNELGTLGGKQGGATPIIEKKDRVYVANLHASALRGLCCWREFPDGREGGLRGRDSPRWQLVEGRYKGNLAGEEHGSEDGADAGTLLKGISSPASFDELSKARFKMTARSVLLAISSASFLKGHEPWQAEGGSLSVYNGSNGASLAQRWRGCDQRSQLSLARANPQAYYDEVTVCGNCMEICRKLDSIRNAGFPDGTRGGVVGTFSRDTSLDPLRPSSEPLPDSTPATSEKKRPGTAAADIDVSCAADKDQRVQSRLSPSPGEQYSIDVVEGGEGGSCGNSSAASLEGRPSQAGAGGDGISPTLEPATDYVDEVEVNHEPIGHEPTFEESGETAVAQAALRGDKKTMLRTRREKARSTAKSIDRLSGVYSDNNFRRGAGKLKGSRAGAAVGRGGKARSISDGTAGRRSTNGEMPSVSALARFAIEREQMAREMGVDELGGPATLGVVNVGARSQSHGRGEKGSGNSKRAQHQRQGWNLNDDGGRGGGEEALVGADRSSVRAETRSTGEMLLEKLESVAEARSIESAGGPLDGDGRATHGDWPIEESSLHFNDHGMGGAWGAAPAGVELSTTESAFLERSRRFNLDGGVSSTRVDSLFGDHFEAGFRDRSGGGNGGDGGGGGAGQVATIGALRDRLATVEAENTALRARAHRAEEERAAEAARGDRASKKLAQTRTEFSRAMLEKEEDHRRKELELEEKHSRELANKSQARAEEMAQQPPSGEAPDEEDDGRGTLGIRERSSKSLIGRLEQALKEMAEQQQRFAREKRALLAEKTQEVASAEAKGRRELQESRSLAAAMEDRASSLQEQVTEAAKQISTLSAREDEQRKRRQRAEEESDKIRKDISVLRQTVQASQSMDVTDESGGRRDAQSTLAAVTATSEARIRTLNNKVDFLKAQLASEQALKAEVEAALALSRKSVSAVKDDARRQAAESEKAKELAVEEAVTRVRRQLEESMSENYRVQSKVQALQDQLSDALGDVSTARRREEALKAEGALMAAKLKDRSTELAKAQTRANDLAEARAADTESSADRAAREAVIRRLENERQYLKSQLQSEITCKDELREALGTATRQLGEIKVDWAEEQTTRTDEFQRELQAKSQAMSDLNAEKVAMEAEVVAATRQLELLKEGYSKARDNLRAEQSALETARTANRRLREEIKATAEELTATKTQQGENARRHSQSLVAAKSALDECDESKRKQGVEQQIQLRAQILKTGEVQRQLMLLQDQLAGQKRASDRMLAAERLGQGLARWSKNRKTHALSRIFAGAAIVAAEKDVRERTCRALREAGEGACRAQQAAVEEARRAAALMAEEEMAEAERAFAEERAKLLEESEAAAAVAATQVKTIGELQALEASTRRELDKTREEAKETSRRHREQAEKAAQEAEEQARARIEAAIVSTQEACAEASKTAKEELDERWRVVLREHLQKAGEEAEAAATAASLEHDSLLEETQQAFRTERVRLREEAELLAVAATEEERKRGIEREIDARKAVAAEAAAAAALTREEDRRAADDKLSEALAEAVDRAKEEAGVARLLEEEARKVAAMEAAAERAQLEEELAQARERAVKLEGSKWQRASEEAEARAATEQAAAYERGVADRGRRAELEAAQLQDAAEKALEEVKQGARITIEEMVARHAEEVEAEKKRVSEEQAIVREEAIRAATEELTKNHIKAVANAREAATAEARERAERERAAAVEAAKERERLATDKVKDELRCAKTEWTTERRRLKEESALFEQAEQKAKDELLRAMANSSQATQRARARWETGQKAAMEKAAAEAVEEREKALEDARRAFGREKKRALLENQEAFTAQAEAMTDRLQKQAMVSLQQAKDAHAETRQEKDRLATELAGCRKVLEESEATLMRFEEDAKEQSVSNSLRNWKLATAALQLRVQHKKSMEELRKEAADRESEAEQSFEGQKLALSATVDELLELAFDSKKRFAEMQETLVNHKREVLIDHKVQSSSLHKELDSLARDREQLEDKRVAIHMEFRELEVQAKDAEKAAHAHSRQSAIGPDGMIIPARARKKRRLDEELEGLLEAMEAKRKALAAMDGKLATLAESRSVKDEEMKGLERTLVQVLVEQQKKLLALLSEAGEKTKQLEDIHEKTQFARDEAKRRRAQLLRQQKELREVGG